MARRTWARETPDGTVERGCYNDVSSGLVREIGVDSKENQFEPIEMWFDEAISDTVAISSDARAASISAARENEDSWRQYMDFAFGQQGMPRDMAKFADPQDKFLARYMISEFEKEIPHTQSEQQLRAVRFEEYWKLLRFALPVERQQQLDDAMQVAGGDMELFGKDIQRRVGVVAMGETVNTITPVASDNFILSH